MRALLAFFVDRSLVVNLITVATLVFGVVTFLDVPRTLMPRLETRTITVSAELPGASAVEVERLVTFRLEEVLQDVRGLDALTSDTENGVAALTLTFEADHRDMAGAMERIKARLATLEPLLPRELRPITVELAAEDRMPGPEIHLVGADDSDPEHRRAVQLLVESLQRVPSVVAVSTSLRRQDLHVTFDEARLAAAGLDVTFARSRVAEFLRFAPVGHVRSGDQTVAVELDQGFSGLESLRALPLTVNRAGYGVTLERVADVQLQLEDPTTLSLRDGGTYVSVSVFHSPEGDTVRVSERVQEVIDGFGHLPEGVTLEIAEDVSELITHELGILQSNAIAGFVIVLGILLVFLGWRIAAMTAIGLPFCYLGGIMVLDAMGETFNLISLFSLILVLGILVDDAIIVAEAFAARLVEGRSPRQAAIDAAHDMFRPVLGMMLTTSVAFLPILLMANGNARPLAVLPIVVLTLLSFSLIESFFVLPNHLADFMPADHRSRQLAPITWARQGYRRILRGALRLRYLTVPAFAAALALAGVLVTQHMEVIGSKSLGNGVRVHVELPSSASLEQTQRAVAPLEAALAGPDVRFVETSVGRSYVGGRALRGFRFASIEAFPHGSMAETEAYFEAIEARVRPALEQFEAEGHGRAVLVVDYEEAGRDVVKIYVSGTDRIDFHAIEDRIRGALAEVEGVHDVFVDPERLQETWRFQVDHRAVLTYGLTAGAVAAQLRQHVPGPYLERVRVAGQEMAVYTHFAEDLIPEDSALQQVSIMTPRGIAVPLRALGRWERIETMRRIQHKDLLRVFQVDALFDAEATTSADVAQAIEAVLAPVRADWPGYHISVEEPQGEAEFRSWAIKVSVIVCGLLYVILALSLSSLLEPLIVMMAIPFGLTGVIFALYAHGMDLEIMAIMGVLGLIGVVVNDSLVVLDTVRRERLERPDEPYADVVVDGADKRFQAVLLTSLTTLGGVFPLAYGLMGDAGWIQPMVFALGWGLVFATLLTLVLLPAMLAVLEDLRRLGRAAVARLGR